MLMLMALVETRSRAVIGAVFGPDTISEPDYATRLFPPLHANMLILADRAFDADAFLPGLADTGAVPHPDPRLTSPASRRGAAGRLVRDRKRWPHATVAARLSDGPAVASTWCLP